MNTENVVPADEPRLFLPALRAAARRRNSPGPAVLWSRTRKVVGGDWHPVFGEEDVWYCWDLEFKHVSGPFGSREAAMTHVGFANG